MEMGQVAEKWDARITEFLAIPDVLGLADHGDFLEAHLLHSHYDYLEQGHAFIVKLGVPIRGTGRFGRVYHGGVTLCDFVGWVRVESHPAYLDVLLKGADAEQCREEARALSAALSGGRDYAHNENAVVTPIGPECRIVPVAFEAKRRDVSKGSGWRWQCSQTLLHQRLAMQMVEGWLGGWGFLLISLEEDGYLLNDVRVVRASQLVPGTSVDLRECPSVELGLSQCDWLPVVKEMYDEAC